MEKYNYENIKIYKYENIRIYILKNINVENEKEYVKKEYIYIYIYIPTETLSKKQINETKKKNIKIYRNVYKYILNVYICIYIYI